jgi:hypothetical protein
VLVTLLVIWVIAIPALTVVGTYVASGILRRRTGPAASLALLSRVGVRIDSCPEDVRSSSARHHGLNRRTRGHAIAGR